MMAVKTRHASLADGLGALRAYLFRSQSDSLIGTNWSLEPDNDNRPGLRVLDKYDGSPVDDGPDHGWEVDKRMETKPSLRQIMRQVKDGDVERNQYGQIISIGTLHFAGGDRDIYDTPSEVGYKIGADGRVVKAMIRIPVGGMRYQEERNDRMRGTDNRTRSDKPQDETTFARHIRETNEYIAETLRAHLPREVKGKRKRGGKNMTHTERLAMLAEAYANTPVLPPVKKYPAGLPWQPTELWSIFPSLYRPRGKDTTGESWQDICTATIARETWEEALSSLKAEHRAVLEVLPKAQNMTDIGVAAGQSESYARNGGGIRVLQAVNDNLEAALKKSAA